MTGSLTGSTTEKTQLPKWYEDAAKNQINLAEKTAQVGHVPWFGPDVAAFQPQQLNAMQSSSDWLSGFGMGPQTNIRSSIPPSQEFAGGIQGYSSAPMYLQALDRLKTTMPGIYNYLKQFQVDPLTGKAATIVKTIGDENPDDDDDDDKKKSSSGSSGGGSRMRSG